MDDHIELNAFLKLHALAPTGGQAKLLIRSGAIKVNGEIELRNKRKLLQGDIVEHADKKYPVEILKKKL